MSVIFRVKLQQGYNDYFRPLETETVVSSGCLVFAQTSNQLRMFDFNTKMLHLFWSESLEISFARLYNKPSACSTVSSSYYMGECSVLDSGCLRLWR